MRACGDGDLLLNRRDENHLEPNGNGGDDVERRGHAADIGGGFKNVSYQYPYQEHIKQTARIVVTNHGKQALPRYLAELGREIDDRILGSWTGTVHKKENPNFAPALAYVPIADGSSSAAPVIKPSPTDRKNELRGRTSA